MKPIFRPVVALFMFALCTPQWACDTGAGGADPNADPGMGALASPADTASYFAGQVMASLGGDAAWERTRYVSFRWIVERDGNVVANREHSWDRYDGRYRLSFEQGGARHLQLFNVNQLTDAPGLGSVPTGRAWVGDQELSGATRDSVLRRAYTVFVNDTYWALMPFKWSDPGVHLAYEGMSTLSDGNEYATVHLTFDTGLGVTEDQYWGYVDPSSGRMAAWQYHLGGTDGKDDVVWWSDWEGVGDIQFAMSRIRDGGDRFMRFEAVTASETVPTGRFEAPTP